MTKASSLSRVLQITSAMLLVLFSFAPAAQAQSERPAALQPGQPAPRPTSSEAVAISPTTTNESRQLDQFPSAADAQAHEARIGRGDVIDVRIFGVPEMSQELRVSSTGSIVLPLVGQIRVQGLTTTEAEQKIAATLREGGFMKDPQVNVAAKELHSATVSVTGEVGKPGIYPVYGSCRLLDMITTAGGLTPRAGHVVRLTRGDKPGASIDMDISSHDAEVFPGDTVVVTKAGVVYVLGDVGHPAGFVIENRITVLEALALAGGTTRDAKLRHARIIRKGPRGIEQVPVPLKEILRAQREDMELLAGDVLYIPTSEGKAALRLGANSVISAATVLAITRP